MADLSTLPPGLRGAIDLDTDLDAPLALVSAVREFAAAHGSVTATVEYDGRRRGARIVLSGADGASADMHTDATDVARHVCRLAGVDVVNTWEQELFAQIHTQAVDR